MCITAPCWTEFHFCAAFTDLPVHLENYLRQMLSHLKMRSFLLFPVGCEAKMPVRIQLVLDISPRSLCLSKYIMQDFEDRQFGIRHMSLSDHRHLDLSLQLQDMSFVIWVCYYCSWWTSENETNCLGVVKQRFGVLLPFSSGQKSLGNPCCYQDKINKRSPTWWEWGLKDGHRQINIKRKIE